MGGSYSITELQEHVYGLSREVENFQGTMASKEYQRITNDLIKTNTEVLKLKKLKKGKHSREYEKMIRDLNLCLKQLTMKVTNNTRHGETERAQQKQELEQPITRPLKRDPATIIEEYEREVEIVEAEIENIVQLKNLSQSIFVEGKLRILFTQLSIVPIESKTQLDTRRNALFRRLVHAYKSLRHDANISKLIGSSRIDESIFHSDVDSDFDSDFDSEFSGSERNASSRGGSIRSSFRDTGSVISENLTIPEKKPTSWSPSRDQNDFKDHIYENIEVVLEEKRKLMEANNSSKPSKEDLMRQIYEGMGGHLPREDNFEDEDEEIYVDMTQVSKKPTGTDLQAELKIHAPVPKSNDDYRSECFATQDGYKEQDLSAYGKIRPPVEKVGKQSSDSENKPSVEALKINASVPKSHDVHVSRCFATEDEDTKDDEKEEDLRAYGKIRPPVEKQLSETEIKQAVASSEDEEDAKRIKINPPIEAIRINAPVPKSNDDYGSKYLATKDEDTEDHENKQNLSKYRNIRPPVEKQLSESEIKQEVASSEDEEGAKEIKINPPIEAPPRQTVISRKIVEDVDLDDLLSLSPIHTPDEKFFMSEIVTDSNYNDLLNLSPLRLSPVEFDQAESTSISSELSTSSDLNQIVDSNSSLDNIQFLTDEDDEGDDYPEALNLELLNNWSAYSGRPQLLPRKQFKFLNDPAQEENMELHSNPDSDDENGKRFHAVLSVNDTLSTEEEIQTLSNQEDHSKSEKEEDVVQATNFAMKRRIPVIRVENSDLNEEISTKVDLRSINKPRKMHYKRIPKSVDYTQQINEIVEAVADLKTMKEEFNRTQDYQISAQIQEKLTHTIKKMFNMNQVNFDKKSLILYDIVSKDVQTFVNEL